MEKIEKKSCRSKVITFKVDSRTDELLRMTARQENITPSELIRASLCERIHRDVAWQGQVQGAVELLRNEVKRSRRDISIFMELFKLYMKYFLVYNPPLDIPDAEKSAIVNLAEKRRTVILDELKKEIMKNKPGLIEILLADFMEEDANGTENSGNSNGEDDGAVAGGAGAQREADEEPVQ